MRYVMTKLDSAAIVIAGPWTLPHWLRAGYAVVFQSTSLAECAQHRSELYGKRFAHLDPLNSGLQPTFR